MMDRAEQRHPSRKIGKTQNDGIHGAQKELQDLAASSRFHNAVPSSNITGMAKSSSGKGLSGDTEIQNTTSFPTCRESDPMQDTLLCIRHGTPLSQSPDLFAGVESSLIVKAFCGKKLNGRPHVHFSDDLTQLKQIGLPSSHFFFLRRQFTHPVRDLFCPEFEPLLVWIILA